MFRNSDIFDLFNTDIFTLFDSVCKYPTEMPIAKNGLKNIIHRPHNLSLIKDEDGKVVANELQVVTTPFDKDEVSVELSGDILTVKCGTENKIDKKNSDIIYRGISSQSSMFSIKLNNIIDKDAITAKNEHGILTITMPLVQKKTDPDVKRIAIS